MARKKSDHEERAYHFLPRWSPHSSEYEGQLDYNILHGACICYRKISFLIYKCICNGISLFWTPWDKLKVSWLEG